MFKRGGHAKTLGWGMLVLLCAMPVHAKESSRQLQERIVAGLAAGQDVSALQKEARAQSGARLPVQPRSSVVADSAQAEDALLTALTGAVRGGNRAQVAAVVTAFRQWQAQDLLAQERFRAIGETLAKHRLGGEFSTRLASVRDASVAGSEKLNQALLPCVSALQKAPQGTGLGDSSEARACQKGMQAAQKQLNEQRIKVEPRILRDSMLPVSQTGSMLSSAQPAPRPLPAGAAISPAYHNAQEVLPQAEDSAGSADFPLSTAVAGKAQALGYDYVRLYEFVRNSVRTEWYPGAQKGSDAVLTQLAANDVDQATLLISLYRAAGVPARYVHGVIELPVDVLKENLGVSTAAQVTAALARAGVAFTPVVRGGKVEAVNLEHTWVEAYVPYTNYRGTSVDTSGATWVPLMPAVKRYSVVAPTDLWQQAGLETNAFVQDYLAAPNNDTPLEQIRQRLESYLKLNNVPGDYASHLGSASVVPEQLGLLPSSLPARVVSVQAEQASLDASRRNEVRFTLRNDKGVVILQHNQPLHLVSGQRLTLSYLPATVEDHRLVNAFGGLNRVPLYLIRVRPQLKLNGVVLAYGTENMEPGSYHQLGVVIAGPAGESRVQHAVLAGGIEAISIQTQEGVPVQPATRADDTDSLAGKLLYAVAADYSVDWAAAERQLAALRHVALVRPWPSVVVVGNSYRLEQAQGRLQGLRWTGVNIDAASHPVGAVARGGTDTSREFMRLAGLQGSSLEQRVFTEHFQVLAMSADRGIGIAQSSGMTVHSLAGSSVASQVDALAHPEVVKADVRKWLAQGYTVTIPQSAVTLEGWSGSVWRVEDPVSGSAGYFLAGGLAGGETATVADDWSMADVRDMLINSGVLDSNGNAAAGVTLNKFVNTDQQFGTVGQPLERPFAVMLTDIDGRPVRNARITFTLTTGGGNFEGGATSLTVLTNVAGIAEAPFTLGTKTSVSPVFVIEDDWQEGDFANRAGMNEIDVRVEDETSIRVAPFVAYGLPDAPVKLIRTDPSYPESKRFNLKTWSDTVIMQVQDQYENPIANQEVVATAEQFTSTCPAERLPPSQENLKFFSKDEGCFNDITRACATDTITVKTNAISAGFYIVTGNVLGANYKAKFSSGLLTPHFQPFPTTGVCDIQPGVWAHFISTVNESWDHVDAAGLNEVYPRPIDVILSYYGPASWEANRVNDSCQAKPGPEILIKPIDNIIDYQFTTSAGGGVVAPEIFQPNGVRAKVRTAGTPGLTRMNVHLREFEYTVPHVNPDTCVVETDKQSGGMLPFQVAAVFNVLPEVTGVTQAGNPVENQLKVNSQGYLDGAAQVKYRIQPESYIGLLAAMRFYENDQQFFFNGGSSRQGEGTATIPRDRHFGQHDIYTAELDVNGAIYSQHYTLPIVRPLFLNVDNSGYVFTEFDLTNNDLCESGDSVGFTLTEAATVTVKLVPQVGTPPRDGASERVLAENVVLPPGSHSYPVAPRSLTPGNYKVVISGVRTRDGSREEATHGYMKVEMTRTDRLQVGRTLVRGVDIADGNFSMSSADFTLGGRMPLTFQRSYSSGASGHVGPLGVGWGHNFSSAVHEDRCGRISISGGEGGGMRFRRLPGGRLEPFKGYHGTLIANPDQTFDFYSKNGTKYHYVDYGWPGLHKQWNLEYIQDTNGNALTLGYDPAPRNAAKLVTVKERPSGISSGHERSITFTYETRPFTVIQSSMPMPDGSHRAAGIADMFEVVTSVTGPGGTVSFEYDGFGRMTKATRATKVETYTYPENPFMQQLALANSMTSFKDARGNITELEYTVRPLSAEVSAEDGILTITPEMGYVSSIKLPGLDAATFDIDPVNRRTVVNDGVAETTYHWDRYGRVTKEDGPAGIVDMTWSQDDIVMLSRKDQRGNVTSYSYDVHGNVTSESLRDNGENGRTYTRTTTYFAPFGENASIKNRKKTESDWNGNVTTYVYDARGNLEEVQNPEGGVVRHFYLANGDRNGTRDVRGGTTTFDYDLYGNLKSIRDAEGNSTSMVHDIRGRKTRSTDANGHTTRFEYDELDHPKRIINAKENSRHVVYDALGNLVSEEDDNGHVTTYEYDGQNKVTKITRPTRGGVKNLTYDDRGNKQSESDWNGNVTSFDYNDANCLTKRTEPLGKITAYVPDALCNVTQETDAELKVTTYTYDAFNRITRKTEPLNKVTGYEYDGENKRAEVDARNNRTTFDYDRLNRLKVKTEPLGRITSYDYDPAGNLKMETDPRRAFKLFSYDLLNRKTSYQDREGNVWRYAYKPAGQLREETDPNDKVTSYEYDELNHLTLKVDAEGGRWGYASDDVGNVTRETWPNGNVVTHEYDRVNRRTKSYDLVGRIGEWEYDPNGKVVKETDANGNITDIDYNALGYLTERRSPMNRKVTYTHDKLGHVKTETTDRSALTTYGYNDLYQLTSIEDPAGRQDFGYDLLGNRTSETDRRRNSATQVFDELSRLKERNQTVSGVLMKQTFEYDLNGNKKAETDLRNIRTEYVYDREDRLKEIRRNNALQWSYGYDALGRRVSETDANSNTSTFGFDALNRLTKESRPEAAVTVHHYDAQGNRDWTLQPEGQLLKFGYDKRNRLTSETDGEGNTTEFGYDLNGNRTLKKRPKGNQWTYEYDALNRLDKVISPVGTTDYDYDTAGNLTAETDAINITTSFTYDLANRRKTMTSPGGSESYDYDGNGNRTQLTDGKQQVFSYGYDELNRLTSRSGPGVSTVYTLDANGNPTTTVEQDAAGSRTISRQYDAFDRLTAETDVHGQRVQYTYFPNGARKSRIDPDGVTVTYSVDGQNRITEVKQGSGTVRYSYYRDGRLKETVYPNATVVQTYDRAGRIKSIKQRVNGGNFFEYGYLYDENGNRSQESQNGGSVSRNRYFTYDDADRLTDVTYQNWED